MAETVPYVYPLTDSDGRAYQEITMVTGITFRMYEDDPYIWKQITPGENWFEPVMRAWERGEMKEKKR